MRSWPQRIRAVHDTDNTLRGTADHRRAQRRRLRLVGRVNHKRVARVMREHGIVGYRRRRQGRHHDPRTQ